ncbi:MAG: SUMF1/EgtB/PvdO family nonheme iron enzyme [Polyangiaceae bacterium]|nr:SUMF1/EgtB/PvdO family nonheme iron enzyme [Polyangiaceae bacterium]
MLRTDAPLPALADRLLLEVSDERGAPCAGCRRIFDVAASPWPFSFGIVPPPTASHLRLRARLYLARDTTVSGDPPAATAIDARVVLPESPGPVAVPLLTRCLGIPSTENATCNPTTRGLVPIPFADSGTGDPDLQPGSFPPARVPPCGNAPPLPGKVCIDGGLFFFRDGGSTSTDAERARAQLVRISSFYADRDELTVGRMRDLVRRGLVTSEPVRHTDDRKATSLCTYRGPDDPSGDDLPLNCVSRVQAGAYCAAEGARLLRDAEFAYLAGNGARGTAFSWGDSEDVCAHAVVGRNVLPIELDGSIEGFSDCRVVRPGLTYGPVAAALAAVDGDLALGVRGLAGNLVEWVEDDYDAITGPCWSGALFLNDPVCVTPAHETMTRGGGWNLPAFSASSQFRSATRTGAASIYAGFRCARDL